jgi:uroporphyrinogen decarboxylase
MRQAGRSLPEYRARRGPGSILDAVRDPALAAELTLQPVRRYGVDAAVLFSDIVVPVIDFGVDVAPGTGPVVEKPFRDAKDLDRLRPVPAPFVEEALRLVTAELSHLPEPVPVIGFAGGPFTLASYLVEGGPSQGFAKAKALMWSEPDLWAELMQRLAEITLASLRAQVAAGADAVQIFESWGGALSPADYRRYVWPALHHVVSGLEPQQVPRIVFGVGAGELLADFARAGADVVGVDWRVPLDEARRRVGPGVGVQGNLDPTACFAPWPVPSWPWPGAAATSSTWATASCPPPTPISSPAWSNWSTPRRPAPGTTPRHEAPCGTASLVPPSTNAVGAPGTKGPSGPPRVSRAWQPIYQSLDRYSCRVTDIPVALLV